MKKSQVFALLLLITLIITIFSGCSDSSSETEGQDNGSENNIINSIDDIDNKEKEDIVHGVNYFSKIKPNKIGEISHDRLSFNNYANIYRNDEGLYGLISSDGKFDSGAKYYNIRVKPFTEIEEDYFMFCTDIPDNETDYDAMNSCGLMDGKGNIIIPAEYASFSDVSSNCIMAIKVTQITDSEDDSLIYSTNSMFTAGPTDDDLLYKGEWVIFNLDTGKFIDGIKETNKYYINAYGPNFQYVSDSDNDEHFINSSTGEEISKEYDKINNGYYISKEANEYVVYAPDGEIAFTLGITDYVPYSSDNNYFIGKKTENNESVYAIMDLNGKVLAENIPSTPYIYGTKYMCDNKLYDFDGTLCYDKELKAVSYDDSLGAEWKLKLEDKYILIDSDNNILMEFEDSNKYLYHAPLTVSKKENDEHYFYCFNEKEFNIKGKFVSSRFVMTDDDGNNYYDLVDVVTGKKVISDFIDYDIYLDADGNYVAYAEYDNDKYEVYSLELV